MTDRRPRLRLPTPPEEAISFISCKLVLYPNSLLRELSTRSSNLNVVLVGPVPWAEVTAREFDDFNSLVEQPSFRNHYEIPWFKWNVALEVFARQEIAIIENKYLLFAGHVPMNLYPALGRKLTKATRQSYGLHDARARADSVRPRAVHLSCNVNSRRRAYCTDSGSASVTVTWGGAR